MRKSVCFAVIVLVGFVGLVRAHDGSIEYPSMTLSDIFYWNHDETNPPENTLFKGTATVTVTNKGTEAWGDFHFQIYNGFGGDATSVLFTTGGGIYPTSSQTLSDWTIGTTPGGYSYIDLEFYGDPVYSGQQATFTVYTDNPQHLSWFGMMIYPTPLPEPATLSLLALGGFALLRKK